MAVKEIVDINGRSRFEVTNAKIIWSNFAGKAGAFNDEGRRNFNLVVDEEDADFLRGQGFNIKYHEAKKENFDDIYTLKINVSFKGYKPPTIKIKNNHGIEQLDESKVQILDWANIVNIDYISFNKHVYKDKAATAYLDQFLATIYESEAETAFNDIEDSAMNTMTFAKVKSEQ